jgi:hypothetical protein
MAARSSECAWLYPPSYSSPALQTPEGAPACTTAAAGGFESRGAEHCGNEPSDTVLSSSLYQRIFKVKILYGLRIAQYSKKTQGLGAVAGEGANRKWSLREKER